MESEGWVLAHAQLAQVGLSVRSARRLVLAGDAFRPLPGVLATAAPTPETYARAGLARAGTGGSFWGPTAARGYLGQAFELPIHVLATHRIRSTAEVRFHRAVASADPVTYRGWPLVPPAVAAAGVAMSDLPEDGRRALATGLLRIRAATTAQIAAAACGTPRQIRGQVARLVEEVLANAWSLPEALFWRAQVEAHLPVPRLNVPFETSRGRRYVDGYIESLRAGYEIHGRADHERSWDDDLARAADLVLEHGIVLLPIPAAQVLAEPAKALDRLQRFWAWRAMELGVRLPIHVPPRRWRPGS